jgi:hypothetical protein
LLVGVLWVAIALVILKFNNGSVVTVGILTGVMFLVFAAEEFVLAVLDRGGRWIWAFFGVLLTAAGIVSSACSTLSGGWEKGITDIVRAFQIRELASS